MVINFKSQDRADNFFKEFNCHSLNQYDELMYLLFAERLTFVRLDQEFDSYTSMMNYTQLPTCPLCIEKLDSSVTGIYYEMITRTFAYENQNRWKDARATCIVCSKTKNPTLSKASSRVDDNGQRNTQSEEDCARCSICLDAENTWICMICGYCGCGRYKYGHAIDHYFCTRHAPVSYTHLRAHETDSYLVCRLLLEKKKNQFKYSSCPMR
eukprot:TRINITY_DN542_c0_g1_i8.p1 TRINITY_DN542_c0_g1~~TRINITY_DN542_c0_g1_i8.p1  ORF type:complete len:211 (-),score=11.75 TRINITY_DN542_c0_g1_i8:13-645(-)